MTCNKIKDFHNKIKEAKKNKVGSCGLDTKLDNGVRVGHCAIQIKSRVLRKKKTKNKQTKFKKRN